MGGNGGGIEQEAWARFSSFFFSFFDIEGMLLQKWNRKSLWSWKWATKRGHRQGYDPGGSQMHWLMAANEPVAMLHVHVQGR
jgi:hypothetical protein